MIPIFKPLSLATLLFALVACGGGGGTTDGNTADLSPTPTPTPTPTNWSAQAYVKASNAEANDSFGQAVAISGDTMVVGSHFEDSNQTTITNGSTASADNSASGSGAAYVFVRNAANGTWSQQAYLKAPNAESNDLFGFSVAISGDTIVVGAKDEDSSQTTITNGSTASADNSAVASGAAYVFVRNAANGTWSQQGYLKASNADASDEFGGNLAVDGHSIVVGAIGESSNQTTITNGSMASADGSAPNSGAAYVFVRNAASGTWSQQAYLKAPNANPTDRFGVSIGISGDTIVVGSHFEDSSQTVITNGSAGSEDNSAFESGAAYVFVRNNETWSQQAYLKPTNTGTQDLFGVSVAISGDTIVVGASGEDSNQTSITNGSAASANNSTLNAGAAYVFVRSSNNWSQQAYLKAANAEAGDSFGQAVAISGHTIVVRASGEDSNQTTITNGSTASADNTEPSSGAAYVFVRDTANGNWGQQAYLKAPNAQQTDQFGISIGISSHTIVVGAVNEDSNQTSITNGSTASTDNSASNAGAAYVFLRQ